MTRADALRAFQDFLAYALPDFGRYQDAMASGEPFVFHSLISPYLNAGLLTPREVCVGAASGYCCDAESGRVPLNEAIARRGKPLSSMSKPGTPSGPTRNPGT